MRTSATGADRVRRRADAGFTLVELMAVCAVVGVAATLIVLNAPRPRADARLEAERLAVLMTRAREEAALTGRSVRVSVDQDGYRFSRRQAGRWTTLDARPFQPRLWAEDATVAVESPDGRGGEGAVEFSPTGEAEPATIAIYCVNGGARVRVDANGRATVDATRG